MNFITKKLIKNEVKHYSNSFLKTTYLYIIRANGLNKTQKEYKSIIIIEMKKRGLMKIDKLDDENFKNRVRNALKDK